MNKNQIDWLNSLDPDKMYGTLQSALMDTNLQTTSFDKVLMYLVRNMMMERQTLLTENKRMFDVLKSVGMGSKILE